MTPQQSKIACKLDLRSTVHALVTEQHTHLCYCAHWRLDRVHLFSRSVRGSSSPCAITTRNHNTQSQHVHRAWQSPMQHNQVGCAVVLWGLQLVLTAMQRDPEVVSACSDFALRRQRYALIGLKICAKHMAATLSCTD